MTNDTQSGEVARLLAALQEIVDVHKNVPIKMNSPPFLRMTWIANRRREIAELALSEQPQPTGRTDSEREFNRGYMIACCDYNNLFDQPTSVGEALSSLRLTETDVKEMDLSEYDIASLREIRAQSRYDPISAAMDSEKEAE